VVWDQCYDIENIFAGNVVDFESSICHLPVGTRRKIYYNIGFKGILPRNIGERR
jgi:hypothetical protein